MNPESQQFHDQSLAMFHAKKPLPVQGKVSIKPKPGGFSVHLDSGNARIAYHYPEKQAQGVVFTQNGHHANSVNHQQLTKLAPHIINHLQQAAANVQNHKDAIKEWGG